MEEIIKYLGLESPDFSAVAPLAAAIIALLFAVNTLLRVWKIGEDLGNRTKTAVKASYFVFSLLHFVSKFRYHPMFPIIIFGFFLNFAGYSLRVVLPGSLFLDMIGTAAVAIVAGPAWGVAVGILTNIAMFLIDKSPVQEYLLGFAHTNATGGLVWGCLALIFRVDFQVNSRLFQTSVAKIVFISLIGAPLIAASQFTIQVLGPDIFDPRVPNTFQRFQTIDAQDQSNKYHTLNYENLTAIDYFGGYIITAISTFPDKFLSLIFGWISIVLLFPLSVMSFRRTRNELFLHWIFPSLLIALLLCFLWVIIQAKELQFLIMYKPETLYSIWGTLLFVLFVCCIIVQLQTLSDGESRSEGPLFWGSFLRFRIRKLCDPMLRFFSLTIFSSSLFCFSFLVLFYLPWSDSINIFTESAKYIFQILTIYIIYFLSRDIILQNNFFQQNRFDRNADQSGQETDAPIMLTAPDPVEPGGSDSQIDANEYQNLMHIIGIGPAIAAQLNEIGVFSIADLANFDFDYHRKYSPQAFKKMGEVRLKKWVRQASAEIGEDES